MGQLESASPEGGGVGYASTGVWHAANLLSTYVEYSCIYSVFQGGGGGGIPEYPVWLH